MLLSLSKMRGYEVVAKDGEVGPVFDVYFDDDRWTVRYLVIEPLFLERTDALVVSPVGIAAVDPAAGSVRLHVTRDRLEQSPGLRLHEPVSAQEEREYYEYYGWQYFWGGQGPWGRLTAPVGLTAAPRPTAAEGPVDARGGGAPARDLQTGEAQPGPAGRAARRREDEVEQDRHLRSVTAVKGYHIDAADGQIGHVAEFIADAKTWQIPCLIVDTGNWWLGQKVALSRRHVTRVDWVDGLVTVDVTRAQVEAAPEFDPAAPSCSRAA